MASKFCLLITISFAFCHSVWGQYGLGYTERGIISYYTEKFENRTTASGEKFDNNDFVGSHKKLPFNSRVKVTNISTGKSVIIRINDRGPYAYGRIMDVSKAAAKEIGLTSTGTTKADLEVISLGETALSKETDTEEKKVSPSTNDRIVTATNELTTGKTYSQWGTMKVPKGYGVQVGMFSTSEKAQEYCKSLRAKGFENDSLFIQVGWKNDQKVYRILIGEFEKAEDPNVEGMKQKIKEKMGTGCFVVPHFK
jgi:rare lipoprotein A